MTNQTWTENYERVSKELNDAQTKVVEMFGPFERGEVQTAEMIEALQALKAIEDEYSNL